MKKMFNRISHSSKYIMTEDSDEFVEKYKVIFLWLPLTQKENNNSGKIH